MQVVTIETPALGDRSYVVHDGRSALVVDPQRDIDRILAVAAAAGVTITHIAETHLHNDYVSGGLVLARVTGATYLHAASEELTFGYHGVTDGDHVQVGDLRVEVHHTPGHTLHHLSYVVRHGDAPPALFSGGSLLYGTVGRTDLIGRDETDRLTREQYQSAHRLARLLPPVTQVYPTHGFGSFCASAKSDAESDGSLATELQVNLAFTIEDEDDFVHRLLSGLDSYPRYYAHMAPLNAAGPLGIDLSAPAPVDPVELRRRIHRGEWVVDLRNRRLFAAEHLVGTIGIELSDAFSTYLGWLIPWGTPLTLLADTPEQIAEAQRQLVRIGIDRPSGAATGGPSAASRGDDVGSYDVTDFAVLARRMDAADPPMVLDVRRDDEWRDGHIVGSRNVPLHEILERIAELPDLQLWVHCASGFRAAIAASLLHRAGKAVVLIDDDFDNAAAAGVPMTG